MIKQDSNFYKNFHETNPALILGLTIVSFGFYVIYWIFLRNRDFEELDKNAPDSKRAVAILMVLPFAWFFITKAIHNLFGLINTITRTIEVMGWLVILFLLLKYLFDFCISYGRITRTIGVVWFIFFIPIVPASIGYFFWEKWFLLFLIPTLVAISVMQAELNSKFKRITFRKEEVRYFH
jgi:hypothetical protein